MQRPEDPCGAYPPTEPCSKCDAAARRDMPGKVQGIWYVCDNSHWTLVIDWCECEDEEADAG